MLYAALDTPVEAQSEPAKESCTKCRDAISTNSEKVQLLIVVPKTWTISRTSKEFKVSSYTVKEARALREAKGIKAIPGKGRGNDLSEDAKDAVIQYYQHDEVSRVCPGQKDFVSVRTIVKGISQREHKQKHLLMANLHEIYIDFKQKFQFRIGFSKFCELRPS